MRNCSLTESKKEVTEFIFRIESGAADDSHWSSFVLKRITDRLFVLRLNGDTINFFYRRV